MRLKYFSREDWRSPENLERKRRTLLVQLHPDKVGNSQACEEMLTEYAHILQHQKNKNAAPKEATVVNSLLEQLPDILRSVGIDPEQVKATIAIKTKELAMQAIDGTLKQVFNFFEKRWR